jgi:hypothetical protein
MNRHIEQRVAALRTRQAQRAAVDEAIDRMLLDGLIEWTGEYRDGLPVYRRTDLEGGER